MGIDIYCIRNIDIQKRNRVPCAELSFEIQFGLSVEFSSEILNDSTYDQS